MRILFWFFIFLLPLHAFLITVLKCKYSINTDFIRFWKEIILMISVVYFFFYAYKKHDWSLKKIYHKNTILWLTTAFIASSAIYMYFPFFELKAAAVLGFRYDVFFLIAFLVWLYGMFLKDLDFFLKILFSSTFWILLVFLPWYLFGDIATLSLLFWYSSEVSTYTANECISFAQNVNGQHRFQWTFGGPIRFSVFLTIVWSLFTWWLLSSTYFSKNQKYVLFTGAAILIIPAIFFSYSKTSMLWVLFAGVVFSFLTYKYIFRKKITRRFYLQMSWAFLIPLALVALLKWELFLHLGAIVNRLDNLSKSWEMFFYNPIGYGLGIAGPASQIGNSIESAGNWQIATSTTHTIHKFLPENWYVQILLEQWVIGFALFTALIILIGWRLMHRVKKTRDYLSIWITTAYFALCFMALFTHAFEEAATSYILFFFIWIVLAESIVQEQHRKKK